LSGWRGLRHGEGATAGILTKKIWFKVNAPLTTAFLSYRANCASFRVFLERALVWGHAAAGIAGRVAFELSPEWFSSGPWIVETTTNSATAEGGGTATIYGYGFGSFGQGQQAPGLQVSIGGQAATKVQYLPTLATAILDPYYPFPLEAIVVTCRRALPELRSIFRSPMPRDPSL